MLLRMLYGIPTKIQQFIREPACIWWSLQLHPWRKNRNTSHSSLFPGTDVDLMVKDIIQHAFQNGEHHLNTSVSEIGVSGIS
jgi:hypothetical protein